MKKTYLLFLFIISVSVSLLSQVPHTFSYQAVAKDSQGNLLSNQNIMVRIGILKDEALAWQEDHFVSTNELGFFTLKIGNPEALNTSGSAPSFSEISWGEGTFQLQIAVDAGSGFEDLGISEIQSVPFALYAADGPGGTGPQGPQGEPGPPGPKGDPGTDSQELSLSGKELSISGGNTVDLSPAIGTGTGGEWDTDSDTVYSLKNVGIGTSNPNRSTLAVQGIDLHPESPLFEVRREDGFPVFAVYNDGVMVFVDDEAKGKKGGFAVGGYSRTAKGINQEYMTVTPDSVRIYVPETVAAKGKKGGFAVGGYSRGAKGPGQDFLFVNPDSTRVYVPNKGNDADFVGLQGGFAVSGYTDGSKGPTDYLMGINKGITRFNTADNDQGFAIGSQGEGWGSSYLELTPTNSFIGTDAGWNNHEVNPEDEWGLSSMNIFVGYQTGMENVFGHHNTFMGFSAGTNTLGSDVDPEFGSHNVFIGSQAGFDNTDGSYNVYMGYHAGMHNLDGIDNVFIGTNAGAVGLHSSSCTMVGTDAGREYTGSGEVTFLGQWAGNNNSGYKNTYLGNSAGANTGSGNNNVSVGFRAGRDMTGHRNVIMGSEAGIGVGGGGSTGSDNTLIGHQSGKNMTTGSSNVMLGTQAGNAVSSGYGNVFLGHNAGYFETGNNSLYIDNSTTRYPLIFGDFASEYVDINGSLYVTGGIYETSDMNKKTNIRTLESSLDKVMALKGVSFEWSRDKSKGETPASGESIGVIAQDVEAVLPALVGESRNGTKAVNYSGLIPVLLEAIKEQQGQIELLEKRIAELEQ